ncbi:MAG: hypothetical protein ACLRX9_00740 [Streptococcus salivarius]
MLRKTMKKRLSCSLIWIPIAIVVMFCIAGYGMSQGINVPSYLSSGFNVISKGSMPIQVMSENYLGDLFPSQNLRKQ